uniref:Uncharacterized protein n=1 Tax=Arundo donax TaxID=35708 RepID=A0A0A9CSG3_ARUDO
MDWRGCSDEQWANRASGCAQRCPQFDEHVSDLALPISTMLNKYKKAAVVDIMLTTAG